VTERIQTRIIELHARVDAVVRCAGRDRVEADPCSDAHRRPCRRAAETAVVERHADGSVPSDREVRLELVD
jgi:hypothetical protein